MSTLEKTNTKHELSPTTGNLGWVGNLIVTEGESKKNPGRMYPFIC